MVVINTDPWELEDLNPPQQESPQDAEKTDQTLFSFQDLASDYYQVIKYT